MVEAVKNGVLKGVVVFTKNMRSKKKYDKIIEAYELAAELCLKILRDEMHVGVTPSGGAFEAPVVLYAKLAGVVEIVEKIQKGRKAADVGELDKLDEILSSINKQMFVDLGEHNVV